jgi:hypothetical protein
MSSLFLHQQIARQLQLFLPILCLLLTACGRTPQPTATPTTQPTIRSSTTPQPTHTITATRPPTSTAEPTPISVTSTPEPPTAAPTAGPAEGVTYRLAEWTPEQVNELDAFLQAYPDTTGLETNPFWGSGEYWDLFRLPALVKLEAIRRFPENQAVADWQWGVAYDLGRSEGDQLVSDYYAFLITAALNKSETTVEELPIWWQQHEPRLTLTVIEVQHAPGNRANYILFLNGLGGAYFWLVESDSGFQLYPLLTNWYFYDTYLSQIQFELNDVTGDGFPEAITLEESIFDDEISTATIAVFNLVQLPPHEIAFRPPAPNDYITGLAVIEQGNKGLQVDNEIGVFVDCTFPMQRDYLWNGAFLELDSTEYPALEDITRATEPDSINRCVSIIANSAIRNLFWGDLGAAQWLESSWSDELNPVAATDELRFRLGLAHAFIGDTQAAINVMNSIVVSPAIANSQWITPAQQFLAVYQPSGQLVQACISSQACYPFISIEQLASLIPADTSAPVVVLQSFGVPIEATGSFDFEHDQQPEQWFLARFADNTYLELWLLSQTTGQLRPIRLGGTILDAQNATIAELPSLQGKPFFRLSTATNNLIFSLERETATQLVFRQHFLYAEKIYQAALHAFLFGEPAEQIRDILLINGQQTFKECQKYRNFCPELLYLLGLTYELSGDEANAITPYLQLRHDYPDHPYNFIIRAKLEPQ